MTVHEMEKSTIKYCNGMFTILFLGVFVVGEIGSSSSSGCISNCISVKTKLLSIRQARSLLNLIKLIIISFKYLDFRFYGKVFTTDMNQ